jgi:hypothetical protein
LAQQNTAIETVALLVAERFATRAGVELFDTVMLGTFLQELDNLFSILGISAQVATDAR